MKKNTQQLSEDLKRFNKIIGYDVTGKKMLTEAPGDEEEQVETGDNPDFDFGEEGSPESGEEQEMTDIPTGETPEDNQEQPTEETPEDEFGTADEFSAVDDVIEDDEVEEIDVTELIKKSDKASETAELAAQTSQETNSFVKDLMDRFSNLENELSKMDSIMTKVSKIESDVKTPEEKLELRSLDSYPFNMKLTDYWNDKVNDPTNNYQVTNNDEEVFTLKPEDINDYNQSDIKNSFNPTNK